MNLSLVTDNNVPNYSDYVQRHVLKVTYGEIIEPEPGQDPLTK